MTRWGSGGVHVGVSTRTLSIAGTLALAGTGAAVAGVLLLGRGGESAAPGASASALVTVPSVTEGLPRAYARLHAAGLRVAIRNSFSISALCVPLARAQRPYPGAVVPKGTAVSIRAAFCVTASLLATPNTSARVPDFGGRPLAEVVDWAAGHRLYWDASTLPSLPASDRARLLDNYRVTGQTPGPGATLRPGVLRVRPQERSFRPTPLVVSATPVG